MRRCFLGWPLLLAGCLLGLLTGPLHAQDGAAGDDGRRLAELQARLRQERAALAADRASWQHRREALMQERDTLAGRLLSARLAERQATRDLEAARSTIAELEPVVQARGAAVATARDALRTGVEQTLLHARQLPGHETTVRALEGLLTDGELPESPAALGEAATTLARHAGRLHAEAMGVTLRPARVWTPDGTQRDVDLLAAGHAAFLYRTADGRHGIALASPEAASGYRWSEALTPAQQAAVQAAFVAAREGRAVPVPMDVSGRMQPAGLAQRASLLERLRAGGPVMLPLALVAVLAGLIAVERTWMLYGANVRAGGRMRQVLAACRAGRPDQAQALAERARGTAMRVAAACLRQRYNGQAAMEDGIQEQLLYETPRLERFLGGLAVLAATAPLLGLLGTVTGIIRTFGVVQAFGNANPNLMAGGIAEALVTTAAGLVIAIPILLGHSILRGRMERVLSDAESHAATVLNLVTHGAPVDEHATGPRRLGADQPLRPLAAGVDPHS